MLVNDKPTSAPGSYRWSARDAWRRPLPHLAGDPATRWCVRVVLALWGRQFLSVEGLENLPAAGTPFILAGNHSTRREAVLVPGLLMLLRGGQRIHFIADWNSMLVPGVGFLMRRAQVIVVMRKPARPRWLNVLQPLYRPAVPAFTRAGQILAAGGAVGVFPEGTTNRHPGRLLAGYAGAARLSLESGAPLIPMGIRHPLHEGLRPIRDSEKMQLVFGEPVRPPGEFRGTTAPLPAVRDWHAQLMENIARLCGKQWTARAPRSKKYVG